MIDELIKSKEKQLKIIVLECPYHSFHQEITQSLFAKNVNLKIQGYKEKLFDGILPVDENDYVADHIILCWEIEDSFFPITAWKSLRVSVAENFHLKFPVLSILESCENSSLHLEVVKKIVDRSKKNGIELSYDFSWTVDPHMRKARLVPRNYKDIFTAMFVLYHQDYGIQELFASGVHKFKTDKYFESWGYKKIEFGGAPLPPLSYGHYGKLDFSFMHMTEFSQEAKEIAQSYLPLWQQRLHIGKDIDEEVRAA